MPISLREIILLLFLSSGCWYQNCAVYAFQRAPPAFTPMTRKLGRERLSGATRSVTTRLHQTSSSSDGTVLNDPYGEVLAQMMMSSSSEDQQTMFNIVEVFVGAINAGNFDMAMACCSPDVQYVHMKYPKPFGREALERHLRLSLPQWAIENVMRSGQSVALQFCKEDGLRKHAFFHLDKDTGKIYEGWEWEEPTEKQGRDDLQLLSTASKVLDVMNGQGNDIKSEIKVYPSGLSVAEQYFAAFNRRDVEGVVDLFAKGCLYDDTVFDSPLMGTRQIQNHIQLCADTLPETFRFVVDEVVPSDNKVAVRWHVENNGQQLPFTRGCSFYTLVSDKIKEGVDIMEPPVFKTGGLDVFLQSVTSNLLLDPIRLVPTVLWGIYMFVVFFSNGILPGANALELEERTWKEVLDLSLNFFFVSPLLSLPFAPVVHPMLEGVFNLLLSWAALFAGFLSDDRRSKPNPLPMLPLVVGMQFLTSAFLLPYLATRTTETRQVTLSKEDLSFPLAESKLLGPFLGTVGAGSIAWAILARYDDFGGWAERLDSFGALLSIDRVGSSFMVDLVIFAIFQGWLVDDDLRRRGVAKNDQALLRTVAAFVPFFGLAIYMTLRPSFVEAKK
mmetsp:Transcript_31615/g.46883  ORF Transcript_31615/g.46883 Transcript_31615/m.46883 type:complete len:614 (-) Transcript_31615:292-2133(-)